MDPFAILDLTPMFDLDPEVIEAAYLQRAVLMHPDLGAGDAEEIAAAAAGLNEAKRILLNPETRADALLSRMGGPAMSVERGLPPGFLEEILSVREAVEEARAGGVDGELVRWREWSQLQRSAAARDVAGWFDEASRLRDSSQAARRGEVLRQIRVRLNAWRYIERLLEQLDAGPARPA